MTKAKLQPWKTTMGVRTADTILHMEIFSMEYHEHKNEYPPPLRTYSDQRVSSSKTGTGESTALQISPTAREFSSLIIVYFPGSFVFIFSGPLPQGLFALQSGLAPSLDWTLARRAGWCFCDLDPTEPSRHYIGTFRFPTKHKLGGVLYPENTTQDDVTRVLAEPRRSPLKAI